ncbi:phage tail assembly protein [Methylobacterium isbiliense]|jgi:hypothetical protein|uniref:Phage tail assembly protein n=1 Tax=Methylobacterium isbiliense TaxID=315478 RepID=A0ABQ4SAL9_9HYPH|nr:phage tail assembly protein [Methylobacterium isbiliense]MDN3625586.1 phage tail assembly protein [Methylobacterium isbiliense]GJE00022.1 hypothetical protein GMJLKIPL_1940 [Methylobacterium isbiliense]
MTASFQSLANDFEPVGRAEAAAARAAAPPVAPAASAPTPAPAPTVTARIVGGPPRSRVVLLTWPIEFEGRVISEVTVRRMSAAEVRAFVDAVTEGEANPPLPMFEDADGRPIPAAVLDAMDNDDFDALDRVSADFLPAALRGALTSSSTPQAGDGPSPA